MIQIFLLVALLRVLTATHKPFLCSGIYAGGLFFLDLLLGGASGASFQGMAIAGLFNFGLASLYFWILEKLDGSILWWIVAVGGIGGLIFLGMASLIPEGGLQ